MEMASYKIFAITLLALVLSGCGTFKKSKSKPVEAESTQVEIPGQKIEIEKKVLYPAGYDPARDSYADDDRQKAVAAPERPHLAFSESESAHVRLPAANPLPECGYLDLDLDKMRSEFCFPYEGKFISNYGPRGRSFHSGVDIKTVPNDTIRAAFPGVVRMSKMYSGYGNIVVIQHYYGFETAYAHCSKNLVSVNDVVESGQPIGLGGRTGRATTEHLHFEFRVAGQAIDPNKLLDVSNHKLREGTLRVENRSGKLIAYTSESELRDIEQKQKASDESRSQALASAQSSAVKAADQKTAKPSSAVQSSASAQYHKVQKGDTLYALAKKYATTVRKLCELNNIRESSLLQINQKLRIK